MQSTMIFMLLPAIAMAMNPDRHVREQGGEHVQIAVQSDGNVVKVSHQESSIQDSATEKPRQQQEQTEKKLDTETKAVAVDEHMAKATMPMREAASQAEKKEIAVHSQDKEVKVSTLAKGAMEGKEAHKPVQVQGMAKKARETTKPKKIAGKTLIPEGIFLVEEAEAEESWKSAFFFFASLVLFAVVTVAVISIFYYNRDQSQQAGAPETEGLKSSRASASQYMNDSSSTSDSGEKIAMLFDRVRQSLEDLSDKAPAGQADAAGGGDAQASNTI